MNILQDFREKAKKLNGKVVLPESYDPRVLEATEKIIKEKVAKVVLIGKKEEILKLAKENGNDISSAEIINPETFEKIQEFADFLYNKRKHKGITEEEALKTVKNPLYFGALLIKFELVNGMVAGAVNTTGNVLRAALHIVGVKKGLKTVSSSFIMVIPDFMGETSVKLFGDCAVVPEPNAEQLADIAVSTAETHRKLLGKEPKVALLSFSTKGSAKHPLVNKVLETKSILEKRKVDFDFDGELQLDAAVIPSVGKKKAPESEIAGSANTLIFPDLQAANIGYKLTQRFAKAEAIGPVIQGLAGPICDLSRGCSADDIYNTTSLALLMSQK